MYREFLKQMDKVKTPLTPYTYWSRLAVIREEEYFNSLEPFLKDIFSGQIIAEKEQINYRLKDTNIPIQAAASSIKELAPLYLILEKYIPFQYSLLIEEPEAHLHPDLQRKVARLLSYLVNEGTYLQITTHSDYFLNQINNLIKLHKIKQLNEQKYKELLKEFDIEEECVIDPAKIGAYYFKRNDDGTVTIEEQDKDEGIPFASFKETVDKMIDETDAIDDVLHP
jgi:hypothetical protein